MGKEELYYPKSKYQGILNTLLCPFNHRQDLQGGKRNNRRYIPTLLMRGVSLIPCVVGFVLWV